MAAPVTEPVVLQPQPGDRFLSDLRAAVEAHPDTDRFLIGAALLPASLEGATGGITAVGVPVSDTSKEVVDGRVRRTVPREKLVLLTGPWLVSRAALTAALRRAQAAPDPLQLFRNSGLPIGVVLIP